MFFRKRKKKEKDKDSFKIEISAFRKQWTRIGFNESLKLFHQGKYKIYDYTRSRDNKKLIQKCEELLPYTEPLILWDQMADYRNKQKKSWLKYCKKNNIDTNSFISRDFFYNKLCKKYRTTVFSNHQIKEFNNIDHIDIPIISPLLKHYAFNDDKTQLNDLYKFLSIFPAIRNQFDDEIVNSEYLHDLKEVVIQVVKEHEEGIIQSKIHEEIENGDKKMITEICYHLNNLGVISREKEGSSYRVHLT